MGYMSILSGEKQEFPGQEEKQFCLQLWEKLELWGKALFNMLRS